MKQTFKDMAEIVEARADNEADAYLQPDPRNPSIFKHVFRFEGGFTVRCKTGKKALLDCAKRLRKGAPSAGSRAAPYRGCATKNPNSKAKGPLDWTIWGDETEENLETICYLWGCLTYVKLHEGSRVVLRNPKPVKHLKGVLTGFFINEGVTYWAAIHAASGKGMLQARQGSSRADIEERLKGVDADKYHKADANSADMWQADQQLGGVCSDG